MKTLVFCFAIVLASFAQAQTDYQTASQQMVAAYNFMKTKLDGTGGYISNTLARLHEHEACSGYGYQNEDVRGALEYKRGPLLDLNRLAPGAVEIQQAADVAQPGGEAEYLAATSRMLVMATRCALIASTAQTITDAVEVLDERELADYEKWCEL